MNIFDNRVQSFQVNQRKWPHKGRLSAETLARSGFYYSPGPSRTDNVICFLCDARLDRWRNDSDPMERHGRMAPDCPWVILSFPHTQQALFMSENAKSTRLSTARVRTFKKNTQWPPKSMTRKNVPTAKKLAEAGFYYAPTKNEADRVACAYCLVTMTGMNRTTDLLAQHDSSCIFSINKNTDIKQGPITRQRLRASKNTPPLPSQPIESQSPGQPSSTSITLTPTKRIASIDDSIWDIGKVYAQKDRIVLTYSKKTQQQEQQKQQDISSILPKHLTEPTSTSSPSTSSSASSSSQKEINNRQETTSIKSQPKRAPKRKLDNDIKGKGKVISHQQTKKTLMTPSIPTTTTTTTTTATTTSTAPTKEKQQTPSSIEPSSTTHLTDDTQQPQSSPIITSPNIQSTPLYDEIFNMEENDDLESLKFSPIRPINSFRHPTILQQHQGIMQSTPNTQLSRIKKSGLITTSDEDDDQMKGQKILEEEDPRKRLKPFSPPSSPSRRLNDNNRNYSLSPMASPIYQMTSPNNQSYYSQSLWIPEEEEEEDEEEEIKEDNMIMAMENQNIKEDELMEQVNELSEEELNMTVEEYIISLMNKEIENVEAKSNEYIQQIQSTVDRIRQQIMNK